MKKWVVREQHTGAALSRPAPYSWCVRWRRAYERLGYQCYLSPLRKD